MSVPAFIRFPALLLALTVLAACSANKKQDYTDTAVVPPLEVPPDLSSVPANEQFSPPKTAKELQARELPRFRSRGRPMVDLKSRVLPEFEAVRMERAGSQRWLVVRGDAESLWLSIRTFVRKLGMDLSKQNPEAGFMETAWQEERPLVAGITYNLMSKVLGSVYSTETRDKFRIRLERGREPGTMEVYVSHRGLEEVLVSGGGTEVAETLWQPRPPDLELEAEFLRQLMVYLGENLEKATQIVEATPVSRQKVTLGKNSDGAPALIMEDTLELSWRRVGLSLDRAGFTVQDRDRAEGIYYVRYIDPTEGTKKKGLLSGLFGDSDDERKQYYQVRVQATDAGTEVTVFDQWGSPDNSDTSEKILKLLYEQLS